MSASKITFVLIFSMLLSLDIYSQPIGNYICSCWQTIQSFSLDHRSEEANTFLLKYSKVMRAVLVNSQHSEVPLKEDVRALEWYMELESLRLKYPFTCTFHIDETVDVETTGIPPLILQPFVENAIWHGLQYQEESGHINIYISQKEGALDATVEDNGVGCEASSQVKHLMLENGILRMKLAEKRLKVLIEVSNFNARFAITRFILNGQFTCRYVSSAFDTISCIVKTLNQ